MRFDEGIRTGPVVGGIGIMETAMATRYGNTYISTRAQQIARAITQGRPCDACQQPLSGSIQASETGDRLFHRTCPTRSGIAGRQAPIPAVPQPRLAPPIHPVPPARPLIIGYLRGVACSLGKVGCAIETVDQGTLHERFDPGAFDRSIAQGGQQLKVDHEGPGLRGRFVRLCNDGGVLVFKFALHNGPREQLVKTRVQAREISTCSMGFVPQAQRWDWQTRVFTDVQLTEISLLSPGRRAAWYGTHVSFEPA